MLNFRDTAKRQLEGVLGPGSNLPLALMFPSCVNMGSLYSILGFQSPQV